MNALFAMHRRGRRFLQPLLAVLFPPRCLVCGAALAPAGSRAEGGATAFGTLTAGWVCAGCAGAFQPTGPPMCPRCGILFAGRDGDDHLCGNCLKAPPRFSVARAAGVYDGPLLALIQALKYRGKTRLAKPLGVLLYHTFCRYWPAGGIDAIVPVPLHPGRLRQRGFNQAALMVRHWQAPAGATWQIVPDALVRIRRTASQAGLHRRAREKNIRGAFAAPKETRVRGMRMLLIDDVLTTGATADACARALIKQGAESVDLLTLARAV